MERTSDQSLTSAVSAAFPPARPFILATLTNGIQDLPPTEVPDVSPSDVATVIDEGIPEAGLRAARSLGVSNELVQQLADAARARATWTLHVQSALGSTARILAEANVRSVLLKGPALARMDPLFKERTFTDLDLLVVGPVATARDALMRAGYVPSRAPWQPRATSSSHTHATGLVDPRGVPIDLHRLLPPPYWGARISAQSVYEQGTNFVEGIVIPSRAHASVFATLQVLHDMGRGLRPWRDASVLLSDGPHIEHAIDIAKETGSAAPFYVVASAALRLLGRRADALERLRPAITRHEVARIRLIENFGRRHAWGLQAAAGMPIGQALRFMTHYAWPDDEFLRARVGRGGSRGRVDWLSRAARTAARGRPAQ